MNRSIGIFYEHPDWFVPLFDALERRGIPYERLHTDGHVYDPRGPVPPYSLVFNRMSPSAWLRGRAHAIFYTLHYMAHLQRLGVRTVNGYDAWRIEISKAKQLSLLERLGLPYPRTRIISDPRDATAAAADLRFPVLLKPNIGGSGAGIRRFDSPDELRAAVAAGDVELGLDRTALVQELIPAAHDRIVRVEVVGGRYIYAIRILTAGANFNLCPADLCTPVPDSEEAAAAGRAAPLAECYAPPPGVVEAVERILATAGIEVGGVEYLIDSRDGQLYFYDINATSNFVADPVSVLGFDPFETLVDYLAREADLALRAGPPGDEPPGPDPRPVRPRGH